MQHHPTLTCSHHLLYLRSKFQSRSACHRSAPAHDQFRDQARHRELTSITDPLGYHRKHWSYEVPEVLWKHQALRGIGCLLTGNFVPDGLVSLFSVEEAA